MNAKLRNLALPILIGVVIVAAIAVAVVAIVLYEPGSKLGKRFEIDLKSLRRIDPGLISHAQTATFRTGFAAARGIAAGPDGRIYVCGDQAVRVFDAAGRLQKEINLFRPPKCLTVAADGRLYVGVGNRVDAFDAAGEGCDHWAPLEENGQLTAIAVGVDEVFVASADLRRHDGVIGRYDRSGRLLGQILSRDADGRPARFVVPSPYFDVAVGPDGTVWAADPGRLRIATYAPDGTFRSAWGKSGPDIDAFIGCCNPSHIALFGDGRVLTSEKHLPTLKVYSPDGKLQTVVADPPALTPNPEQCTNFFRDEGLDVAIDPAGRVLVLDPTGIVRVFERKRER